jgi:hypothetical protein
VHSVTTEKRKQNNFDVVSTPAATDMEVSPDMKRRRTSDEELETTDLLADSAIGSPMEQSPPASPQMMAERSSQWYEMVKDVLINAGSEVVHVSDVFARVSDKF